MNKILVTGGLGQVGAHIYKYLKNEFELILLDNLSNAKISPPNDCLFIKGDILDDSIYSSLPEIDCVIHTAAQISVKKSTKEPIFDAKTNIEGTLKLLEFARKRDIKKFVYLSSAATFGVPKFLPITEEHPREPLSPYGLSKLVGERYTLLYNSLYNLSTTSLVLFNLYSNLQKIDDPYSGVISKFIHRIHLNSSPIIEGDGTQTRDFIHVQDVVSAIELVLKNDKSNGKSYNIGTGKQTSILELANLLLKIAKKDLPVNYTEPRTGDIKHSYCSISKAQKELNFSPKIRLEEGLTELYYNIV
ncbi:MAG: NAD-dependent epimerase/dehydratase family protein [Candidatus Heimdallarchaeaceae archaeon]